MKINKILGALLTTGIVAASSAAVFAADSFTVGAPIDLDTGKTVTDFTDVKQVAIPVDIDSSTGGVYAFQAVLKYDSNVLSPTFKKSAASAAAQGTVQDVLDITGGDGLGKSGNTWQYINGFTYEDDGDNFPAEWGASLYDAAYSSDVDPSASCVFLTMSSADAVAVSGRPEIYFLFEVKGTPDATKLNTSLAEIITADSMISADGAGSSYNLPVESEAKANACAGAFKITIDSSTVPAYVHALYVSFDGGAKQAIDQYVTTDDKVYDFPVRVTSTKGGSVTAKLYADLGTTADAVSDAGVEIGTVTVDLSGTATDYAAASVDFAS